MAQKFYNESDIQAIASAIRAKNGLSNTYKVSQMASAIQNIPTGSGGNTDIEDSLVTRTISGTYENSRVTSIGNQAFNNCSALTSVNFPQVTSIESYAFYNCSALTSVNFSQVTNIGIGAFADCSALTSVNFPQVTRIETGAFADCYALTSVNFPQVTSIKQSVFYSCRALTSVNFPQVTSIGNQAFYSCRALTSVNFPQVTSIGLYAFSECTSLISIKLGGEQSQSGKLYSTCFSKCYNLIHLTLSGSYFYSLSNSNAFTSTPIAGYSAPAGQYGSIYVPASLYSQYISATNWAYFSSRIVSF